MKKSLFFLQMSVAVMAFLLNACYTPHEGMASSTVYRPTYYGRNYGNFGITHFNTMRYSNYGMHSGYRHHGGGRYMH